MVCVVFVCLITAINDFSKERQFRGGYKVYSIIIVNFIGLQAKIETGHKFSVIRDGEAMNIPVSELVVGDIARVK